MPIAAGAAGGPKSLTQIIALVRQRSDTENDPHVADSEITGYFNDSRLLLYNFLIEAFGDHYYTASAQLTTDGVNQAFPLPDGTLYSAAPAFYKGEMVEVITGAGVSPQNPVTLHPFNLREKNRYTYPMMIQATPYMFPRYAIIGGNSATNPIVTGQIIFAPFPAAGLGVQIWYAPKLVLLSSGSDVADDFGGYIEWAVVDAAIKVKDKQERDCTILRSSLADLEQKIRDAAANRNLGDPNTVIETSGEGYGPLGLPGAPFGVFGGGMY